MTKQLIRSPREGSDKGGLLGETLASTTVRSLFDNLEIQHHDQGK